MSDLIINLLQAVSTTRGIIIFSLIIATLYAGIWYLFLYEPVPKPKKSQEAKEEKEAQEGKEEEKPAKQAPRAKRQKQPA